MTPYEWIGLLIGGAAPAIAVILAVLSALKSRDDATAKQRDAREASAETHRQERDLAEERYRKDRDDRHDSVASDVKLLLAAGEERAERFAELTGMVRSLKADVEAQRQPSRDLAATVQDLSIRLARMEEREAAARRAA